MTILSFVEGATKRKGGMGLVGVPSILRSTAALGHRIALIMGGPVNPHREEFLVPDIPGALSRKEGAGSFGIVSLRAWATWAFAPGILWRIARFVRASDFVTLHSIYSFPVLAGYCLARFYRKPYAIWPHGVLAPFQREVSKKKKWLYDRLIARQILNHASVLFFSAAGEREEAASLGLRAPSVVVPDAIEAAEFASLPARGRFRARFFPGEDAELVVFLARLNAKKGLDVLVQAIASVIAERPQTRLAILGAPDPPGFLNQVRAWIHEAGIEAQTVVTGAVPHETKLEALADADVFALASHAENFGFSVFEAMACRVPVVVSDTLNYADEIRRAGAGLAAGRDPEKFASAILRLLYDADLRRRMGESGLALARSYSLDKTAAVVSRTLESIVRPVAGGRTIVSFVEGATVRKGGIGIVGIPVILGSTASRGHRIVVIMAGPPIPGREKFVVPDIEGALKRKEGSGTFGIVAFKAWTNWAFSPKILWKVGRLVRTSDFVGLHSLYSFPVLAGYLFARYHGKPYGVWLHGVLSPFQRQVSKRKKWLYDRLFVRRILKRANVIFFTARGEREETRPLAIATPSVIVPTGFIAEEFQELPSRGAFRARCLNGHSGPLIVFLGRLNAKKGLDLLAEAMASVAAARPEARLAIVGPCDPPGFKKQVGSWIHRNGIESHTALAGPVDAAGRLEVLADADVIVMPSHAENFGFAVFEAMASRVPVVVSDTLNYAGEIAGAGAGLAVPRRAEAFAGAILRLIDDPTLRRRMGECGARLARSYSWEQTGTKVERVVESILRRDTLPPDLTQESVA